MSIDIKRHQFDALPRKQKDLVIFDNVQDIRTSIKKFGVDQKDQQNQIDNYKWAGGVWMFLLTVAFGLRKWIPIIG